jgi:hypothetical protein
MVVPELKREGGDNIHSCASGSGRDVTLWELCLLSRHTNPTVRRYAKKLLSDDPDDNEIDISKEPEDPFLALSHTPFLETLIRGADASSSSKSGVARRRSPSSMVTTQNR